MRGQDKQQSAMFSYVSPEERVRLDIAQALPVSQLSKTHRQQLVPAREASQVRIAVIPRDALLKLFVGQAFDQLREDGAADVHRSSAH
jgi:hypothetical protein